MKEWMLVVLELLSLAAVYCGVSLIYFPAGLILGGVVGVLICERATTRMTAEKQVKK